MLQWTSEGQELLGAARRHHNGAIEAFRRGDPPTAKRYLQTALRLRRHALPHTHPLVIGTVEMLAIVSASARSALAVGGALNPALFVTAPPAAPTRYTAEDDERVFSTKVGTVQQIARLKRSEDPRFRAAFDPGSPSFTLFRTPDGATLDPCRVEELTNLEELRMVLTELCYLQRLRFGAHHVDTEASIAWLWSVTQSLGDTTTAEALAQRIWEMRCTPASHRLSAQLEAEADADASALLTDLDAVLGNLMPQGAGGRSAKWRDNVAAMRRYQGVQPGKTRRIALLEDDTWEKELRQQLGLDD